VEIQHRLDLAQLDAKPADLHLMIVATEKLDFAMRKVACKVACPIQQRAWPERVLDELFGGLRITTKAPGYNGIMAPGIPE